MSGFVIGIDAGGTSVRTVLAEAASGAVLAEARIGAAEDGGPAILPDVLTTLFETVPVARESVDSVCAGITKITRTGVRARWETTLQALLPAAHRIVIVPDFVIAFHGAVPAGVGIAIVAGTGSVVYGENTAHHTVRVGGRGWEYGDEGSGAWLTTEAVRRTLRALDGLEAATPLTKAVCDALGTDEPATLGEAARQRSVAEGRGFLVPLILARAQSGDVEARNLFVGAAGWLGAQVRAAAQRLSFAPEEPVIVTTIGGMWEAGALLTEPFDQVLRRWLPNAQILPPDASPVIGAVRLARR